MLVGPTIIHWERGAEKTLRAKISRRTNSGARVIRAGAGSDVAACKPPVEEGDYFIVNGQKVWTSDAHQADMCILLVRTDPEAPKHKGISYVLVDMHSPGVTCVRWCK